MKRDLYNVEHFKAWVTKRALTDGIQVVAATRRPDVAPTMITYPCPGGGRYEESAHGNDWHLTEASAIACAEQMRKTRIASLERSIKKLQSLEFKRGAS